MTNFERITFIMETLLLATVLFFAYFSFFCLLFYTPLSQQEQLFATSQSISSPQFNSQDIQASSKIQLLLPSVRERRHNQTIPIQNNLIIAPIPPSTLESELKAIDYSSMTVKQLRAEAKKLGIKNYSRNNKKQLIERINKIIGA